MTSVVGLLSIFWSVAQASAAPCSFETLYLDKTPFVPPSAVRSLALVRQPHELEVAGNVLKPGEKFAKASEGFETNWIPADDYVAVVVNLTGKPGDDVVIYNPIVDWDRQKPAQYQATPESLLQRAADTLGVSRAKLRIKLKAVGRFRSIKGKFYLGNPPPGYEQTRENGLYFRQALEARGLKDGAPQTVANIPTGAAHAALLKSNMTDPQRRAARTTLAQLHMLLAEQLPDTNNQWLVPAESLDAWKKRAIKFRKGMNEDENIRIKLLGHSPRGETEVERIARQAAELLAFEKAMNQAVESVGEANRDGLDVAVDKFCRKVADCESAMDDLLDQVISVAHSAKPR